MEDSNQQSQSPQPVNSTPPSVNSGKSKLIPIILGIAAVAIIAIGAYLLGTKQSQPVVQNPVQTTPIPSPVDETANWKTYKNEEFGFEMKYPAMYEALDLCQPEISRLDNGIPRLSLGPIALYIEDSKGLTLSEYVDLATESEKSKRPQDRPYILKSRITRILGGREGIQVVANWCGAGCNEPHTIYVEKGSKIYRFLFDDGVLNHCPIKPDELPSETADQILSAFKFTDQNSTSASSIIVSSNKTSPTGFYIVTEETVGDGQTITIKDNKGNIITDNVIKKNNKAIGYGIKFGCQCGTSFKGWTDNSHFAIKIVNGIAEEYEYIVDAATGKVDESTFKRIK